MVIKLGPSSRDVAREAQAGQVGGKCCSERSRLGRVAGPASCPPVIGHRIIQLEKFHWMHMLGQEACETRRPTKLWDDKETEERVPTVFGLH